MGKQLRILILEDNVSDAELIQRELRKAGFDFTAQWAQNKTAFLEALDKGFPDLPDLILLDYALPGFDGLTALALSRSRFADIPLILVSGAIGEEAAIDALKAGATDYVLKQRLQRLGPVIRRALQEARQLSEKRRAEEALRQANEQLEERVRQRTADLARTVDSLRDEIKQREQVEKALKLANEQLSMRTIQLRALAGDLIQAEQRERKRLSMILHDGLQQHLAAAKMRVASIAAGQPGENDLQHGASEVEEMLGESIRISRSLSAELSPPALYQSSLCTGLEWLARWMREKHNLNIDLAIEQRIDLAEDVKILLFESVRELLFNAVKHAKVPSAKVSLQWSDGTGMRITVSDEGTGFDPCRLAATEDLGGGLGLFSIRERLALIGGRLDIDSAPGKGSRLSLVVPDIRQTVVPLHAVAISAVADDCEEEI
ncbi:MAG: response regulator [Desulfobacteraceae bacterium]|nr:MAG: response regulator [Desulfobacteraceae bacterium]